VLSLDILELGKVKQERPQRNFRIPLEPSYEQFLDPPFHHTSG
jgi:hypothetical protein